MKNEKIYNVYIATNYPRCTVLYTGFTNNIFERNEQHKKKINKNSFTAKYNINRVVYYETYADVNDAIAREKQIKAGSRKKKIDLIVNINPEWKDSVEESWKD
ncbi:GIY-YIG nuclease family protein [Candidatus Parcubacteria bacterium]|nr:GIY-YIG nuclease family protein [Candidatus Parcubacteria bacterium]